MRNLYPSKPGQTFCHVTLFWFSLAGKKIENGGRENLSDVNTIQLFQYFFINFATLQSHYAMEYQTKKMHI